MNPQDQNMPQRHLASLAISSHIATDTYGISWHRHSLFGQFSILIYGTRADFIKRLFFDRVYERFRHKILVFLEGTK
ncbi:MAG: hypothetical protein LBG23_04125 [Endomicrobium sp.]|jgi:hypothetical protein|nr:hypothetical protein [Endomicrobium sp.]